MEGLYKEKRKSLESNRNNKRFVVYTTLHKYDSN